MRTRGKKEAPGNSSKVLFFAGALVALVFGLVQAHAIRWLSDDVFITLRYVKNWLAERHRVQCGRESGGVYTFPLAVHRRSVRLPWIFPDRGSAVAGLDCFWVHHCTPRRNLMETAGQSCGILAAVGIDAGFQLRFSCLGNERAGNFLFYLSRVALDLRAILLGRASTDKIGCRRSDPSPCRIDAS